MFNRRYKYLLSIALVVVFTACGSGAKIVDTKAPDFSLDLLNGGQIGLTDLKGKPVILYFFASW